MKICVVGAGAVGGLIAARIAAQTEVPAQLSLLARGDTHDVLKSEGLRLYYRESPDQAAWSHQHCRPEVVADASQAGEQDLVILAVKYNAVPALAPALKPLTGRNTTVLSAMNGIPWWFGASLKEAPKLTLQTVDPAGVVSAALDPALVLGCVVHLAASVRSAGQIQLNMGNRLVIGEPSGLPSERLQAVTRLLSAAQFEVETTAQIAHAIWYKLWGNMTMNPISALTRSKTDAILADDQLRGFMSLAMTEANLVGAKLGLAIDEQPDDRHQVTRKLGGFKTSMLQDLEADKPLELDALITVVHEIAGQVDVRTPAIDGLLGLVRVMENMRAQTSRSA